MKIKKVLGIVYLIASTSLATSAFAQDVLVCGDYKVLVVDTKKSTDKTAHIKWEWDASKDARLQADGVTQKFKSMDDCKMSADGKHLLVSSSSRGVALLRYPQKEVVYHTEVGNAHSIEFLPNDFIAVAGSTHNDKIGNSVEIFDLKGGKLPIAKDSLYSGHGVVWHKKQQLLYALGYDVLRAYKFTTDAQRKVTLTKVKEWTIPGKSGHDLTLTPDGKELYVTEHHGAWRFIIASETFESIPDFPVKENIKSISRNKKGQLLYTEPEESWWAYSIRFLNPENRIPFPNLHVYKARWVRP